MADHPLEARHDYVLWAMQNELEKLRSADGKKLPNYEHQVLAHLCQLAACGMTAQKIANQLGIPTRNVRLVLKSKSIQREVQRLTAQVFKDQKKIFLTHLPEAVKTTYKLMTSKTEKGSTQLEAAKVMMDRALGKPTQHIEQTTTLLRDVLLTLQAQPIEEAETTDAAKTLTDALERESNATSRVTPTPGSKNPATGTLDAIEDILGDFADEQNDVNQIK